jgi:hypothetical protein
MKYFSYCVFKAWQINGILHEKCYAFVVISARVTFICNLLFILCLIIKYSEHFIPNKDVQGFVIVLGWIVSFILNIIVNLWETILLYNRRIAVGPYWLRSLNFIVFLFQIAYYFY